MFIPGHIIVNISEILNQQLKPVGCTIHTFSYITVHHLTRKLTLMQSRAYLCIQVLRDKMLNKIVKRI